MLWMQLFRHGFTLSRKISDGTLVVQFERNLVESEAVPATGNWVRFGNTAEWRTADSCRSQVAADVLFRSLFWRPTAV